MSGEGQVSTDPARRARRCGFRAPAPSLLLALVLVAAPAAAQVVINEIDYDQPGSDDAEFIELRNNGASPVNLGSFSIKLIDAAAGPGEYPPSPIALPPVVLAPGDYFVVSESAAAVANTDFVVAFPGSDGIQNGAPDAVQLLDGMTVADTVSYEGDTTGFSEGGGTPLADDDVTPNIGLSRFPDGADTDDNATDVFRRCITPGAANSAASTGCTTPIVVTATKVDAIAVDVDTDTEADPGDTLRYTVEIKAENAALADLHFEDTVGADTTFVAGSVQVTPIAFDDGPYDVTCNVSITVPAGSGVLVNDVDPDHSTAPLTSTGLTAVNGATMSANGGNVAVSTDGSFKYEPPPGFSGLDTFAYTARDEDSLDSVDPGIVSVNVGSECVWFIDSAVSGGADEGTLADPFESIVSLNAAQGGASGPQAGDLLLLYTGSGYSTGIDLLASQRLAGQGVSLTGEIAAHGITLAPFSDAIPSTAGTRPLVTSSDNGIDLASNNTVRGLNIGATSGVAFSGSSVGTATVNTAAITGSGGAVSVTTGTLAMTFDSIQSTSSAAGVDGIFLSGTSGTLQVTGTTSMTGLMGDGIQIVGGSTTLDLDGAVTVTTGAGNGVIATGGTLDFGTTSNAITATGGAALDLDGIGIQTAGSPGITFSSLSSTNSDHEGVKLANLTSDLSVSGSTTISNPANQGIEIDGTGVDYHFGSGGSGTLTITTASASSGRHGIDLNGLTGSFTVTSVGGGITHSGDNNNHGILIVNSDDVTIQGTNAANRFSITGAGQGDGTSSLTSDAEGFQGIFHLNSGSLTVNFVSITDIGVNASLGGVEHGVFSFDPDIGSTVKVTNSIIDDVKTDGVEVQHNNLTGIVTVNVDDNVIRGEGATIGTETTDIGIDLDVDGSTSAGRLVATLNDNVIEDVNAAGIAIALFGSAGRSAPGLENSITIDSTTIHDFDADGIAISIFDNTDNVIDIVDVTIDGVVTPIGTVDPNRGIDFVMEVRDTDTVSGTDTNTSETDLIIRSTVLGSKTTITDCTDEGILIRNFGDDGPTSTNAGKADVRIGSPTAGTGISSSGNGREGLQAEAGLDGEINLYVDRSTFESNSGDMTGDRDVLIGVRSLGNRTIDSYIANTTIEHEIRIESDNTLATTHQFGCDDDGNAGNGDPCAIHIGTGTTSAATISSILTENGVAFDTLQLSLSGGDIDIVDETVVTNQTP